MIPDAKFKIWAEVPRPTVVGWRHKGSPPAPGGFNMSNAVPNMFHEVSKGSHKDSNQSHEVQKFNVEDSNL